MIELDTNDTDVKEELPENADYLTQLLDKLETASATERDKGTRFETLIRAWLRKEPTYADLFTDVQTWKEWASSHPDLAVNARDIGIDLVGTNADGTGYTAIQCKLYARNASVPKAGIDSFLAASAKPFFTHRFLVATNEKWSENVANELHRQSIPVTLITRRELEASVVDWSEYLKSGRVVERPKRTPRPYQEQAIANVVKGFETADRGKLIMACGTGKTFTSMKIAEESSIYPPPRILEVGSYSFSSPRSPFFLRRSPTGSSSARAA